MNSLKEYLRTTNISFYAISITKKSRENTRFLATFSLEEFIKRLNKMKDCRIDNLFGIDIDFKEEYINIEGVDNLEKWLPNDPRITKLMDHKRLMVKKHLAILKERIKK